MKSSVCEPGLKSHISKGLNPVRKAMLWEAVDQNPVLIAFSSLQSLKSGSSTRVRVVVHFSDHHTLQFHNAGKNQFLSLRLHSKNCSYFTSNFEQGKTTQRPGDTSHKMKNLKSPCVNFRPNKSPFGKTVISALGFYSYIFEDSPYAINYARDCGPIFLLVVLSVGSAKTLLLNVHLSFPLYILLRLHLSFFYIVYQVFLFLHFIASKES